MNAGFDNSALTYDQTFTNTNIGRYLRIRVHEYLKQSLAVNKKLNILELNCGTGEDAIFLAMKGHSVFASDSSLKMLEIAKSKVMKLKSNLDIKFEQIDINKIKSYTFDKKYDLVFSNFGGLNCISPQGLKELSSNIKLLLTSTGRFIAVVMSKYCLWEISYHLFKMKYKKAFRRFNNKSLNVNINGSIVETFYYTPRELEKIFKNGLIKKNNIPIGLFLPPTYMESYFKRRISFLSFLNKTESAIGNIKYLSVFGDHFLLDFKVK